MSSGRRKFVVRHPVVVDIGCNCRRPKLPSFFSSMPKPKLSKTPSYFSASTTTTTTTTTTSASHWGTSFTGTTSSPSRYDYVPSPASYAPRSPRRKPKAARGQPRPATRKMESSRATTPTAAAKNSAKKKIATTKEKKVAVEKSVAVVKESSDPYVDFKESMLQMIVEMEIYAWDDLRDLLHRFLALNSPYHHHLILQAFAEICNALFPASSTSGVRRGRR